MNILTFDIEEWYIEKIFFGNRASKYSDFDYFLNCILDVLEENETKATFFCLGELASLFPDVVKKINIRGHEIGCHSNKHLWLTKLNRQELEDDTECAINAIEQCIGKKVISYRAPAFSIDHDNKWAFEVLYQCGIEIDASIFPAVRDFGGFSSFNQKVPSLIKYKSTTLKEFPVPTSTIFGTEIAYSGGGYFRLFPYSYINRKLKQQPYVMTYFHIEDLLSVNQGIMSKSDFERYFKENGSYLNRTKRYIKSNIGKKYAFDKLNKLISNNDFISIREANSRIDWNEVPVVEL